MSGPADPAPPGWLAWRLALAVAALALIASPTLIGFAPHEDGYIVFRHARTLAEHAQFAPSPGALPVEGYSDLLWMASLAAARALGAPLVGAAQALGVLAALVALLGLDRLAQRAGADLRARAALLLLAGSNVYLLRLAVNGLETPLFMALLMWLLVRLEAAQPGWREQLPAGLLAGALTLTRPEAPLYLAAIAVARLARRRLDWRAWLIALLAIVGQLLWRRWQFGRWAPAAYYVKMVYLQAPPERALHYLLAFALAQPLVVLLLVVGAVAAWRRARTAAPAPDEAAPLSPLLPLAIAAASVTFVLIAGGDMPSFSYFRFLLPTSFAALILAAPLLTRLGWRAQLAALLLAQATFIYPTIDDLEARRPIWLWSAPGRLADLAPGAGHAAPVDLDLAIGRGLTREMPPQVPIGGLAAGKLPYAARRPFLDLLGLTSAETLPLGRDPAAQRRRLAAALRAQQPWVVMRAVEAPDTVALLGELGYRLRAAYVRADQAAWPLPLLARKPPLLLLVPPGAASERDLPIGEDPGDAEATLQRLGRARVWPLRADGSRLALTVRQSDPPGEELPLRQPTAGNLVWDDAAQALIDQGQFPAHARWELGELAAGRYRLWVRLRTADPRALTVRWGTGAALQLELSTGSYDPEGDVWVAVGEHEHAGGAAELRLGSPGFVPYLVALRLERLRR